MLVKIYMSHYKEFKVSFCNFISASWPSKESIGGGESHKSEFTHIWKVMIIFCLSIQYYELCPKDNNSVKLDGGEGYRIYEMWC